MVQPRQCSRPARRTRPAADAYRHAVEHGPRLTQAWYNLALVEQMRGRPDAAIEAFAETGKISPRDPQAHTALGDALLAAGRPGEAVESYTRAVGYMDGTAAWLDLATGQRTAFFDCHSAGGVHAVFSPDGRHFATGGLDGLMTLWDVATRQSKPIGRGYRNALHDLLFSPDSRRLLASGTSPKGLIKFWDVDTGRDVATLPGEPGWFPHIGFSPDGNTLFAASMEGTALLWHVPSFDEIAQRESRQTGLKVWTEP